MRIIVVNLDEDTERCERMSDRLSELGLRWERLSAIRGTRITPSQDALIDRDAQAARGLQFSPGEMGCWLSHRMAQRMVAEGPDEMALVLEDDLDIRESLPEMLELLEHGAAGDFDIILLHRVRFRRRYVAVREFGADSTIGFVRPADCGTLAYVITREAARILVKKVPKMIHLADHTLYQHWTHGLIVCSVDPPAVLHDDRGQSAIGDCPGSRPPLAGPSHFIRRKWHQLERKYRRRVDFHKMVRTGQQRAESS